jgi:hypothetical protein
MNGVPQHGVVAFVTLALGACNASSTTADGGGSVSTCGGTAPTVLATLPQTMLADLKIDGDSAYFTDLADTTHISRVSLCGGSVTLLSTTSDLVAGGGPGVRSGVILSLTQSSVVFSNGSSLGELPKAGGAQSVLATNRSGWIGAGLAESSGYLYWMQYSLSSTTGSTEIDRLSVSDRGPATQSVATGLGMDRRPSPPWMLRTTTGPRPRGTCRAFL